MKKLLSFLCSIIRGLGGCDAGGSVPVPFGTISIHTMSSILLDKLEAMGCDADIYLPDMECKVYRKSDVMACERLKEVASIQYVSEAYDCDDFAAIGFALGLGIAWTNVHALNWFVDENGMFWFVEPQTCVISETLEGWQGDDIRFFIGR